jgi:hypothetical protein
MVSVMSDLSFLGDFRCHDLTPVQLDGLLAFSFSKGDLETARSLFASKWWDYRFVHPGTCFFVYSHHYVQNVENWRTKFGVHRRARMKMSDHPIWRSSGRPLSGLKSPKVLSPPAYRTGLWRGMCFADLYGVPYDKWIGWAFEHAFENKWQRLPTPSQLYSPSVTEFILEKWEAEKENLMVSPADPRYLAENFVGEPTQQAFQEWLLGYIKARPIPSVALAHYLKTEPLVDIDTARITLGLHVVEAAMQRVRTPS